MSRSLAWVLASLIAGSMGCSAYELSNDTEADTGEEVDDTADTSDSAPADGDSEAPPAVPSWIRLDGQVEIVGAQIDPAGTTLAIEYRLDSAEEPPQAGEGDAGPALPCTRTPLITAATPETAPDAAITLGWWEITLDATADPACTWSLPQPLHLGLGAVDPQLYAAMDLAGLATSDSGLYGLYVRVGADSEPVWVYGVAGTAAQYAGTDAAVAEPPLPEGMYTLQALHLIPFSP